MSPCGTGSDRRPGVSQCPGATSVIVSLRSCFRSAHCGYKVYPKAFSYKYIAARRVLLTVRCVRGALCGTPTASRPGLSCQSCDDQFRAKSAQRASPWARLWLCAEPLRVCFRYLSYSHRSSGTGQCTRNGCIGRMDRGRKGQYGSVLGGAVDAVVLSSQCWCQSHIQCWCQSHIGVHNPKVSMKARSMGRASQSRAGRSLRGLPAALPMGSQLARGSAVEPIGAVERDLWDVEWWWNPLG